jgi:hypothetical protein
VATPGTAVDAVDVLPDVPLTSGVIVSEEAPAKAPHRGREHPPAYAPCPGCGTMVLHGVLGLLPGGPRIALEVHTCRPPAPVG